MADAAVLRANERVKAFTNQIYNLAAALFAAAVVKVYAAQAMDWDALVWFVGAASTGWGGHGVLGLLQDEG